MIMHIPIAGSFETSLRHQVGHLSSTEPLLGALPLLSGCLCATRRDDDCVRGVMMSDEECAGEGVREVAGTVLKQTDGTNFKTVELATNQTRYLNRK
jgi:hypothetical protein